MMSSSRTSQLIHEIISLTEQVRQRYCLKDNSPHDSRLSASLSTLSALLTYAEALIRSTSTSNIATRCHICGAITSVIERAIPMLRSYMLAENPVFEVNEINEVSTRLRAFKLQRKKGTVKEKLVQSLNSMISDLASHTASLETSRTMSLSVDSSRPTAVTQRQIQRQPLHRDRIPSGPSNLFCSSEADQNYQNKHVHFEDESPDLCIPELSGSESYCDGLQYDVTHEAAFVNNLNRSTPFNAVSIPHFSSIHRPCLLREVEEIQVNERVASLDDTLFRQNYPTTALHQEPPPPYCSIPEHEISSHSPSLETSSAEDMHHDEDSSDDMTIAHIRGFDTSPWVDPITVACRMVMRNILPTTSVTLLDDYASYRAVTRAKSDYRWYLTFRYMSLLLQPDLAVEVFLVILKLVDGHDDLLNEAAEESSTFLAYLFEDCLVFAHSPFTDMLLDPNEDSSRTSEATNLHYLLESGLQVVEELSLRFCHVDLVAITDRKTLRIECLVPMYNQRQRQRQPLDLNTTSKRTYTLGFETRRQRAKIFKAVAPWATTSSDQRPRRHSDCHRCHSYCSGKSWSNLSSVHYHSCSPGARHSTYEHSSENEYETEEYAYQFRCSQHGHIMQEVERAMRGMMR